MTLAVQQPDPSKERLIIVIDCLLDIIESLTTPSRGDPAKRRIRERAEIAKKAFEAYKKEEWGA